MVQLLMEPGTRNALIAAAAMGVACAVLSVLVVLRRWAFIGEGIAHAGFGGVGTAWVLSLAFPALNRTGPIYAIAILFCVGTALGIGYFTRRQRIAADTAIGIFLVAALAWGFVASGAYGAYHRSQIPPDWETYLMGRMGDTSSSFALAAVMISAAVLLVVGMLWKEILAYSFDPEMAEVSGVRVGFIHYLLVVLLAVVIVLAMRLMGNLLVTALLVLPGATALLLSQRLRTVMALAMGVGLTGAVGGPIVHGYVQFVPAGPAIALVLLMEFAGAYVLVSAVRKKNRHT